MWYANRGTPEARSGRSTIGALGFEHDPNAIEQDNQTLLFDALLLTPGQQRVARRVHNITRERVLPPGCSFRRLPR